MRTIKTNAPPVPDSKINDDIFQKSYQIKAITPVFGGGHEAGFVEPDDAVVVRGTSVRGHLRFWWRATHGSFIDSPEALFEKEGEIWGTTKKSSEVIITLEIESCKREKCETSDGKFFGGYPPYALFPFKSNRKGSAIRDIVIELSFQLHIRCPKKLFPQVESALIAWVNFGGIGARTRRGCGALYCQELAPDSLLSLKDWYREAFSCSAEIREWPTLPDGFLYKLQKNSDPIEAWSELISLYKVFRQDYPVGRNQGTGSRPGRSRWPEPESIRKVTTGWNGKHKRMESMALSNNQVIP